MDYFRLSFGTSQNVAIKNFAMTCRDVEDHNKEIMSESEAE